MKTFDLIKKLLTNNPELRNDDKLLQWRMLELQGKVVDGFLTYQGFKSAKSTETIRRSRQMVQAKHPELSASGNTKEMRDAVQKTKGTWVFRDNVAIFQPTP